MDKGSNVFDRMVVRKRRDSMDLYKFEIGDIYWKKGYIEHNDHFFTNSESNVFEALDDDGGAKFFDKRQL